MNAVEIILLTIVVAAVVVAAGLQTRRSAAPRRRSRSPRAHRLGIDFVADADSLLDDDAPSRSDD